MYLTLPNFIYLKHKQSIRLENSTLTAISFKLPAHKPQIVCIQNQQQ